MSILPGNILAESPEAAETARLADSEFEKKKDVDFGKNAEKLGESLGYKPFVAPEQDSVDTQTVSLADGNIEADSNLQEQVEVRRAIQEGIHSPYVDNMMNSGLIDASQASDIKEFLVQGNDIQNIDTIPNLPSGIAGQVKYFLHYTNTEEATEEASIKFGEDFGSQFADFQNDSGIFKTERTQTAYDSIAAHYFPIGENPDAIDDRVKNQALDTAIKTTYNMEIDRKQFKRTVEFTELSNVVNDSEASITERFEAFISLRDIVDTDQGAKGGRRLKDTQMAKRRNLLKNAGLEEVYKQQQQSLRVARESGESQAIKKAELSLQETIEQAKDLSDGEIGSFDTTMEIGGVESGETKKKII